MNCGRLCYPARVVLKVIRSVSEGGKARPCPLLQRFRISESITVGTKPDVIEVSPTVLVPLWCRRDLGKEFYTVRVHE
jgi:hypothetical protein